MRRARYWLLQRHPVRFNGYVPDAPTPVPVPDPTGPSTLVPDPLEVLKSCPDACRSELACEIDGVLYPAADSLGAQDVLWWLDFLQLRVAAARSLVSNVLAGAIGATFGLVVAFVSLSLTTKVWLTVVTVPITVLLVSALAWYFLRDSHHRALEQRWMLYRRRARGLGLTP